MTSTEAAEAIIGYLPFRPNADQIKLAYSLGSFITERFPRDIFLLNGYAGTGKTSVMGALVKTLKQKGEKVIVLAPTGRAAKVASFFSGGKASTIHKQIFRGNSLDPSNTQFFLAANTSKDTLFIVDEASLIPDNDEFNRSLLQQLVRYVYSVPGCSMILVGDLAQLPPVGQTDSLAMNPERLRQLSLSPISFTLMKTARQAAKSGILYNATVIRKFLFEDYPPEKFRLFGSRFPDVTFVDSRELPDTLSDSWATAGKEETLIITRSNKRANDYNRALRNTVMYAEEPLERGDRIVISKNDYFWSKQNGLDNFIANGEMAEVIWVGKTEKRYDRIFTEVELKLPNEENPIAVKINLKSLEVDGPALPREEMEQFYNLVMSSYEGSLSHKIKGAMEDPYYNALQVKYAYCITCHKAQGGQWKHVYIDMGGINIEEAGKEFYRWLYTAVTRATERLFFINANVRHD